MTKEPTIGPPKNYLTTTQLAELCGVSRFTILNWIKQGKINAIKTIGGKYRIGMVEAKSFLDSLHIDATGKDKEATADKPDLSAHCWEYPDKVSCPCTCEKCLIYEKKTDYCFIVVQKYAKGVIPCQGNCLECSYFTEFFKFDSRISFK